ncbi:MAG: flagellar hook-associated protein FlgK [Phycisphaerales bacterium]
MSLSSAIYIARSALTTSQIGIQVAGQNLANIATPGYTRQLASLSPIQTRASGRFLIGQGVQVTGVRRQINEAIQRRLWASVSDESSKSTQFDISSQVEGLLNELTGYDLSSELSGFFNSWSEIANLAGTPAGVVEQGDKLAGFIKSLRTDLGQLRRQVEDDIDASVVRANSLLDEIAGLNSEIQQFEGAGGTASSLRDQRDGLITELSGLLDVTTVEDPQGNLDILVGSTPIVLGGVSRGLDVKRVTDQSTGTVSVNVIVEQDGEPLDVREGSIGGLLATRNGAIDDTIDRLNKLASQLIFHVNSVHATGRNASQLTSTLSNLRVGAPSRTMAINDPNNDAFADLPFQASNGSFYVEWTNKQTGATGRVQIDVDLDGITNAGVPGTADDTTPEDIRAAIDAIDGLNATWDAEGHLSITADSGYEFSFADDSSNILGVMGVNSFFTGEDAGDIGIRQALLDDPTKVMLGRSVGGIFVENANALAMADLRDFPVQAFGGVGFQKFWLDHVQHVGTQTSGAQTQATSAAFVRESLQAQRDSVSGVDADEESVNLIMFQQAYNGAAKLIQIANEMLGQLQELV